MTTSEKPAGTTMEGMVWNANHVIDLALHPGTKKSRDVLKDARGVIILNAVQIGLVFAGTRGSGVVLAKNEAGEWSAPSAVALTSFNVGIIAEVSEQGILIVFDEDEQVDKFLSGASIEIGAGLQTHFDTPIRRDDLGAVNQFVTQKGVGSCYAYMYKHPNTFQGMNLNQVTIKHKTKANDRFYGKSTKPFDIVRKEGEVNIPDGSGIPDLHKKLIALEAGDDLEVSPEMEEKKEQLRKEAVASVLEAKEDLKDDIEEVKVITEENLDEDSPKEKAKEELKDKAKEELKDKTAGDLKDMTTEDLKDKAVGDLKDRTTEDLKNKATGDLKDKATAAGDLKDKAAAAEDLKDKATAAGDLKDKANKAARRM